MMAVPHLTHRVNVNERGEKMAQLAWTLLQLFTKPGCPHLDLLDDWLPSTRVVILDLCLGEPLFRSSATFEIL